MSVPATSADNVLITGLDGNTQWLDAGSMFGNVPRPLWQAWTEVDGEGRMPLACRSLLLEQGRRKVLCETGIGAFFAPKLAERFGVRERSHRLLQSLAQAGTHQEDIDVVILSHLHFDHAGGLLPTYDEMAAGQDGLLFPRATYVVGREAFARAKKPHLRDRASFIPGLVEKLEASGRLVLVDADTHPDIWPERLSFRFSNGHTPGQMHTVCRGDRQTVMFCGDLIPGTPWVHLPITMGYDRYPELLIEEKQELYTTAVKEAWLLFFTHDTKTAAAQVQCDAQGRYVHYAARTELTRVVI